MNRQHELYVDMNEVMKIFHSFDNSNSNDNGVTADSDEQMNLVDEIIDEYNLIPSNIKVQKKSNNKNYKEQDVTQFECVKSNSKVSNSNSNSNSSNSISNSRETKANGGNICKFNFNNTEHFTIVKESNCCITGGSSGGNNNNNINKCCCCIVDSNKITQLIKLINALHTKLNETNTKLTALSTSLPKVNFPSENTHNNKYTISSNTNAISYLSLTSHPDNIANSNKPKRSYNDTFTFNTNASKKQQPITSFLHKQFKHK